MNRTYDTTLVLRLGLVDELADNAVFAREVCFPLFHVFAVAIEDESRRM